MLRNVGIETQKRKVRYAKCCGTCDHCITRWPWDDPIMYGCAVETEPSDGKHGEKNDKDPNIFMDSEWWHKNWTRAEMICNRFKMHNPKSCSDNTCQICRANGHKKQETKS